MHEDEGYSRIFAECQARSTASDYSGFRDDPAFWFLLPIGKQREGPDFEALGRAAAFNVDLCAGYMKRPKSHLGYADTKMYRRWDVIDSHHIMALTFIFGTRTWPGDISVVEIGGGFGNWVRLNHTLIPHRRWTILDLPFVSKLQRWYLENEVGSLTQLNVELVDSDRYEAWKTSGTNGINLVIGSHSLSELDWDTFCEYFENVVRKAPVFYYATQRDRPSAALVRRKLTRILEHFEVEQSFTTEGGRVANTLFRRK